MEKLTINNFLVIKKSEIEVKRINIIIGPQANGKSLVAKILNFCKTLGLVFIEGVQENKSKRELDNKILKEFEERFPRYTWEGTSFDIKYQFEDIEVYIIGRKNSKQNKTTISIRYSDNLARIFVAKKKIFQKKLEERRRNNSLKAGRKSVFYEGDVFFEHVVASLRRGEYSSFFMNGFFIPASRSFFANLQKNIFSFLASNLDIDPYLKEFGKDYENAKRWYKAEFMQKRLDSKHVNDIHRVIEQIIAGDYEFSDEQDWIIGKQGSRINLANASSGQQESLPMLITLYSLPIMNSEDDDAMCFIEEPEAHLFPTSQGHVVSIISQLYAATQLNFFMTTHSPYIISAINNFILASDKVRENLISIDEFRKINGSGIPIRYEDVAAYSIENGVTINICDDDYRLVGAGMLDKIGDHYERVMHDLLGRGE